MFRQHQARQGISRRVLKVLDGPAQFGGQLFVDVECGHAFGDKDFLDVPVLHVQQCEDSGVDAHFLLQFVPAGLDGSGVWVTRCRRKKCRLALDDAGGGEGFGDGAAGVAGVDFDDGL